MDLPFNEKDLETTANVLGWIKLQRMLTKAGVPGGNLPAPRKPESDQDTPSDRLIGKMRIRQIIAEESPGKDGATSVSQKRLAYFLNHDSFPEPVVHSDFGGKHSRDQWHEEEVREAVRVIVAMEKRAKERRDWQV